MRFARIIEFDPVQHQPVLRDWFRPDHATPDAAAPAERR
jgi:hypothetical protein